MTDTASATVVIQCDIGQQGLDALLSNGLQLPFPKHAVQVNLTLSPEIKAKLLKALGPNVSSAKERKKTSR